MPSFIYEPPLNGDNMISPRRGKFSMFSQVLRLNQSWAELSWGDKNTSLQQSQLTRLYIPSLQIPNVWLELTAFQGFQVRPLVSLRTKFWKVGSYCRLCRPNVKACKFMPSDVCLCYWSGWWYKPYWSNHLQNNLLFCKGANTCVNTNCWLLQRHG